MPRWLLALLLLPAIGTSTTPARAADCHFDLGFRSLHDLIPDTDSECLVDQSYGYYDPPNNTVYVSNKLLLAPAPVKMAAIVHGLRHMVDVRIGGVVADPSHMSPDECLGTEVNAVQAGAAAWTEQWRPRQPPADGAGGLFDTLNEDARAAAGGRDPLTRPVRSRALACGHVAH